MKRLLLMIAGTLAFAVAAMPTGGEIKRAEPIVNELMKPLVADYDAKRKTAVQVGDAAMDYVRQAETEGAKLLLLKGAIRYYAFGKDDGKAVAACATLTNEVKNIPPRQVYEILKSAIDGAGSSSMPVLFRQYEQLSARLELARLKKLVDAQVADDAARRRYVELLAATGDWKAALAAFAKSPDPQVAGAAKAERSGKRLATVADRWWDYATREEYVRRAFRAHAAELYRRAIDTDELTGLARIRAEKRIEEAPSTDSLAISAAGGAGRAANVSAAPRGGAPSNALYCVIDLSAGPNASKYPVSYFAAEPPGGFNVDEYKTTKLVLRRIDPGKFKMEGKYEVTLTKPFWCGIFEVTQKQYELVTGGNPSKYKGDMRPVEKVSWNTIRGDSSKYNWPSFANVDPNSFMGKLRVRTGLDFDLPTEAQWEYACRAGTTSKYNNGSDSETDLKKVGRFALNQKKRVWKESDADFAKHEPDGKGGCLEGHTVVGSYQPNAWGLYDMHGNVWEWCLDWWGNLSGGVTDPSGSSSESERVRRGGSWRFSANRCASSDRSCYNPSCPDDNIGFRLFRTLSN